MGFRRRNSAAAHWAQLVFGGLEPTVYETVETPSDTKTTAFVKGADGCRRVTERVAPEIVAISAPVFVVAV